MWIRAVLAIFSLGSLCVYLLYRGTNVFGPYHLQSLVFWQANISAYDQHIRKTKSCCQPLNSTQNLICEEGKNCSITCNDYQSNEAKFVKSLGNEAFFLETAYSPTLNYRQACSVESLALNNPNITIHVLMSAGRIDELSETIKMLKKYPNIDIRTFDPAEAFLDSPLEHWYFCTDWFTGPYRVAHLADALRFLTLYKYGGYYFDLDVVTMRPLTAYRNFSAAESSGEVAIGVMHFDFKHPAVIALVEEFRTSYNKNLWSHAGPGAITRVLKRYCQVEIIENAFVDGSSPCKNFTIYRPSSFYPLHYSNWEGYFRNETDTSRILNEWNKSDVLAAHVWNKITADKPVFKNSGQLYSELGRRFCPLVYSVAPDRFKK